ncbi:hypothetical protein FRC03_003904 [Tulasnella sp. 419]|nr:hypothetical protein FRC03_003904 [Tulasnella sp. 419]
MSSRSSLQTNSRPASPHAALTSPHQNSSPVTSTPVDRQPSPSSVHPPSTSQSISKTTGILNDDVEKQLSGADQAVDHKVDPSHPKGTPLLAQVDQKAAVGQANDPSASPDPNKNGPSNLDQYADFWNVYNKVADKEDEDFTQ